MAVGDRRIDDQVGDPGGLDLTAWRWRDAESRLYSLVVADPDLYQLAVTVVAEAAEALRRSCADLSALLACEPAKVLEQCGTAAALRDYGLDPTVALDAARAQRLRELS